MSILPCCLGCALPKIFNAVANAVEWILRQTNIHVVHYLDLAAHALSGCDQLEDADVLIGIFTKYAFQQFPSLTDYAQNYAH